MKKEKLVLVGNGMAGVRTLEELLTIAPDQYDITVFGAEPYGNYNRILLSPVLSGEKTIADIMLNDRPWYAERQITLHTGAPVDHIDRGRRQVRNTAGVVAQYDRLLLATGSEPFILPIPGADLPGVVTFRDIRDVETMLAAAQSGKKHAVVIGGGLLGLEAANGLMLQGMAVTVVHLLGILMERQLDIQAAILLRNHLEARGLRFRVGVQTAAIMGNDHVEAVRFMDGTKIPADLVVMAVGIRPNVALAKSAGIHCHRGIVVDDTMLTYDPRTYAVGECVEHRGQTYGLVAPLWEQARVCANHLAYFGTSRYRGSVTSTKLKVTGIDVFSAGDFHGGPETDDIVLHDKSRGVYKKLVIKGNQLQGAVLYGDTIDGNWYFQLLREKTDISAFRESILFGQAHLGHAGHGGGNNVLAMPDDAEICGCNGVRKGTIVKAIIGKKLFTIEEVRAHTKASASCGSCTGLVEQLLAATVGDYSKTSKEKPLCTCTDHSHDQVRQAIREYHLTDISATFAFLEWKTPDGCHVCRPAINYYLIATWPKEAHDDARSRFINERVHANIQKDGTYSVVPRIWGGLTTPAELRAIANVAEKFNVPTVKMTGGQRIDLLGVAKEDLPKMWADLNEAGMVSGHAYGKSLRTVKTCVGSDWCRFGTQDSMGLGVQLEKLTWGSWTPHKFKMAVSGCPRNCAEATIKDFGIVCVDSGYELHIGGNGGITLRGTDLLCRVRTEAEAMEYCAAFLQLYREEARYLERTAPWIERVGLAYIRQKVVDDAKGRKELEERFLVSQQYAQIDPWAERASGRVEAQEFQPLKQLTAGEKP